MKRPPIRTIEAAGAPEAIGHAHGSAHAAEIQQYASERLALVTSGLWSGGPLSNEEVRAIADSMLPAHAAFDADLHNEMLAMAEAAGITPADAIIAGGFTDFVDTVRAVVGGPIPVSVQEDDCTAVIVPDSRADGAGVFGQTWDMHDTATDHVVLLRVNPTDAPAATVFTTTGCLGQIGMNAEGVCVGINNLVCLDGQRGVTWPTVVRAMLKTSSADEALAVLKSADVAGAHNFLIFDRHGAGYNVEAMPTVLHAQPLQSEPLIHTNHTIATSTTEVQAPKDAGLLASSDTRLKTAEDLLIDGVIDAERVMQLTREPNAICQRAEEPYHIESSGGAVMRPSTGDFWACWGRPEDNDYEHFTV